MSVPILLLVRTPLEHKEGERDLFVALAARLVLQAVDNDRARLESALA